MTDEDRDYRITPTEEEQSAFAVYGKRQTGETMSEAFLLHLCERSFLSLWSYSGVHRLEANKIPKEVCDVLVLFGNDIIIFSDKHHSFGEALETRTSWTRWYKRAIKDSVRQLHGAELYIRGDPNLFVDKECKVPFPFPLPEKVSRAVHLVSVARGAAQKSREYFGHGSGSLMTNTSLRGDAHFEHPFMVGRVDPDKRFVHVFDEIGLEAAFGACTTIRDFITYLVDREELLTKRNVLSAGEENTVAGYFLNSGSPWTGSFKSYIDLEPGMAISFSEGLWDEFTSERRFLENAEIGSRLWDGVIETITQSMHRGRLVAAYPATIASQEEILRLLAAESRSQRVYLSSQMRGLHKETPQSQVTFRLIGAREVGGPWYAFLCRPRQAGLYETYDLYREERREHLLAYCHAIPAKYPACKKVIGMAFENEQSGGYSVDVLFVEMGDIPEEQLHAIREKSSEAGLLVDLLEWKLEAKSIEQMLDGNVSAFGPRNLKIEDA